MMKTIYVLSAFFVIVTTSDVSVTESHTVATTTQLPTTNPTTVRHEVVFCFYTRSKMPQNVTVTIDTIELLKDFKFDPKKPTMFIIHGWRMSNAISLEIYEMRKILFFFYDVNLFVVDWSTLACKNYLTAQRSVVKIGKRVADFITSLVAVFQVKLASISLVGHSLGAHICGNAGAALRGNIRKIIGLDPAGVFFTVGNIDNRLDRTDGKFVQVIHTNDGKLGFKGRLGHADYYPNGGSYQPGCGQDWTGECSHNRAYAYYSESLINNNFIARRCSTYYDYLLGFYDDDDGSFMGSYSVDKWAKGSYYLQTNYTSPYALGYVYH